MNEIEINWLSFVLGYHITSDKANNVELYIIIKSISQYYGNINIDIANESEINFASVQTVLETWGLSTILQMFYSGMFWYRLNEKVDELVLFLNNRKGSKLNDKEKIDINTTFNNLKGYLFSNNIFYAVNYFFDYFLQDLINDRINKVSRELNKFQDRYYKANWKALTNDLFILKNVIVTLIVNGGILKNEKVYANISNRTLNRSKIRAMIYISPLLLLTPPIIVVILLSTTGNSQDILSRIASLSGGLSILGILLKFVYDSLVPNIQKKIIQIDLENLEMMKIYSEMIKRNFFGRAELITNYPLEKYFLTSRKIEDWTEFVSFGENLREA